jgi:hypothetical protein
MQSAPEPSNRDEVPAPSALPRPGMNLINRVAMWLTSRRRPRHVERSDLDRWIAESIAAMRAVGADNAVLDRVRLDSRRWIVSSEPAPSEVWCGEIKWPPTPDREPETYIYPDSPWGRIPNQALFELGGQTGIDHMVSHLYRYVKKDDFSEEAACTDQVRLMLARPGIRSRIAGWAICLGLRLHKEIPLREFRVRLATPLP